MSDSNIDWDEVSMEEQSDNFAKFEDEDEFLSDSPMNQDIVNEPDPDLFESGRHKKEVKFGYVSVGLILIGVLIFVLIMLGLLDRVQVTKKSPVQQPQAQVQQGVVENTGKHKTDANSSVNKEDAKNNQVPVPKQEQVAQSSEGLRELPADTVMDYAGAVVKSKGTIHDKVKYLSGDMVIYCLKINTSIGGKSQMVDYYCGYNVFSSVSTGDEVTIDYQLVSRNCFSVNTISK